MRIDIYLGVILSAVISVSVKMAGSSTLYFYFIKNLINFNVFIKTIIF